MCSFLVPNFIVLNPTSTVNFSCVNHQSNDPPLMTSLSKNISNNRIELFRHELNKTTIHIRLQLKNYIGIFHLFCYAQGKESQGTRADVIVKSN